MAEIKHEYKGLFGHFKYMSDGSLVTPVADIPAKDMQEIANEYKGANRIHKPAGLLFWQDCKNGLASNWV